MKVEKLLLELTKEAIDCSFYRKFFQVRDAFQIGHRTLDSDWPHVWFKTQNPKTNETNWVDVVKVWHDKKNHNVKIFINKLDIFIEINLLDPKFTDKYANSVRFLCHEFLAGTLHTYEVRP